MGRRIVHAGLVLGRQLGPAIEAAAHGRGAVFEQAVAIAVARRHHQSWLASSDRIGAARAGPAPRRRYIIQTMKAPIGGCERSTQASLPVSRQGRLPAGCRAGKHGAQVLARDLGIEQCRPSARDRRCRRARRPKPPNFCATQLRLRRGIGPAVDRIPDRVPADHVAHRVERAGCGTPLDRLRRRGFRERTRSTAKAAGVPSRRPRRQRRRRRGISSRL